VDDYNGESEDIGCEIVAPAGYYLPIEKNTLDVSGRMLLYIRGSACIESSCCGVGSWEYIAVVGYVKEEGDIVRVEDEEEQESVRHLLSRLHPNARIEFH
jgi:hypothetical protein